MHDQKLSEKARALKGAAEIFKKKGFNATSMNELMVATGMNRSKLYGSFSDKHNLYLQALEYSKSLNTPAPVNKVPGGIGKIEALFKGVINFLSGGSDKNMCLSVDSSSSKIAKECCSTAQVVCNSKEEVEEIFLLWLNESQDEKLKAKSSKIYSQYLYNTLCGLRVMSEHGASKHELNDVVKITLDALNWSK